MNSGQVENLFYVDDAPISLPTVDVFGYHAFTAGVSLGRENLGWVIQ